MPKPALGILIDDGRVVIAGVSRSGDVLDRYSQVALPPGVVEKGDIKNKDVLAQYIAECMKQAKPRPVNPGAEVVFGLSDDKVLMQSFSVPAQSKKRIEEAIAWKGQTLSPLYEAEVVSDWKIVGKNDQGEVDVLWMVVRKSLVEDYIEVIGNAGLTVKMVEPTFFGSVRAIWPGQLVNGARLVVYAAPTQAEMMLVVDGKVRFSSVLRSAEIQAQGGWLKMVQNTLTYISQKFKVGQVIEVVVTGEIDLSQIFAQLQTGGIRVAQAKPRLSSKIQGVAPTASVAGILIEEDYQVDGTVDLLPEAYVVTEEVAELKSLWLSSGVVVLAVMLAVAGGLFIWRADLQAAVSNSQAGLVEVNTNLEQSGGVALREDLTYLNGLSGQLAVAAASGGGEAQMMQALSAVTPSGVRLTSLLIQRGVNVGMPLMDSDPTWVVTGVANSRDLVLVYFERLVELPEFEGGKLFFGSLDTSTQVEFRIASGNER